MTHLLVIDDDQFDREAIKRHLRSGYAITEATTVSDGLAHLRSDAPIDCVILDHNLPDKDGLEAIPEIASFDVPILMLTGQGSERVAVDAMKQGCLEYLTKHKLDKTALANGISHVIEKAQLNRLVKEAQAKLRDYAKQLEAKNRDLELFSSFVAHDIRGPLNSMIRAIESVDPPGDSKVEEVMAYCQSEASQAMQFVQRILDYSRATADLKLSTVSLRDVLEGTLLSLKGKIDSLQADIRYPDELPEVTADAALLKQLFQNLIENALNHAGDAKPQVAVLAECRDGQWQLGIQDHGPGVSPEDQERIFKQYNRATDSKSGIGLGLTISRQIVEAHRGELWVESDGTHGSVFWFTLPES